MLQTLFNHEITRKQLSVYSERTAGMLGRTNLGRVSFSLQQQFADIDTCVSIPVNNKPTGLASVSSVITADFVQSSASATELGSVIGIDSNNINLLLGCDNSEGLPELKIRYFIDNLVGLSTFRISKLSSNLQVLNVLNSNMGNIELVCEFDNLIADLKVSCSDEVKLGFSYSLEGFQSPIGESLVINASQFCFPDFKFSSLMLNILPKIELPQDFSVFIENSQSKTISINVNSHSIPILLTDKFFPDTNLQNPFISLNQLTRSKSPSIRNMAFKPLEQSVFCEGKCNHFPFFNSRKGKERCASFSLSIFEASQIKLQGQSLDFITELSSVPNNSSRSDNQLSREFIFQPKLLVGGLV